MEDRDCKITPQDVHDLMVAYLITPEYTVRFWEAMDHWRHADWVGLTNPEEAERIRKAYPFPEFGQCQPPTGVLKP